MTLTADEQALVRKICDAKHVQTSATETDVLDAIENGDTSIGSLAKWLDEQRVTRPHLFVDLTVVDLESRAFGEHGKPNITARGQLIKSLGESAALKRAEAWGLKNLHDYTTRGVRPDNAKTPGDNKKLPGGADNPWSKEGWNVTRQGALYRANPKAAAEIAARANSFIGATKPAA
jgi:hypothetical protein